MEGWELRAKQASQEEETVDISEKRVELLRSSPDITLLPTALHFDQLIISVPAPNQSSPICSGIIIVLS